MLVGEIHFLHLYLIDFYPTFNEKTAEVKGTPYLYV